LTVLALAGLRAAALLQGEGEEKLSELPSYGQEFVRMLLSLGVVLALLLVVAWFLPRWLARTRPPTSGRHLEVVDTVRLDARRALYLVRVEGELVLIGAGEGGLVRLAGATSSRAPFAERLRPSPEPAAPPATVEDAP